MAKEKIFTVGIQNDLKSEKRKVKVHQHSTGNEDEMDYQGPTSHIERGLREAGGDFLRIGAKSVTPRLTVHTWVQLPEKADLKFIPSSKPEIEIIHAQKKTFMRIPPGPFDWALEIRIPSRISFRFKPVDDNISISDNDPGK